MPEEEKKKPEQEEEKSEEFQRFETLAKRLFAVPKRQVEIKADKALEPPPDEQEEDCRE
ncbi:MAG TPA: hypothetical protein VKU00_26040 [Chthonomonadaceae bacterium]|nr:hypothetical protein [Chthonomonadaceae bacterium]